MSREQNDTRHRLRLSAILELWDRGLDTQRIAEVLREHQADIERGLHEGQAMRREQKAKEGGKSDLNND